MTKKSPVELIGDALRNVPASIHMLLQKQDHHKEATIHRPPLKQSAIWVSLPVCIYLRLQPENKPLSSAQTLFRLLLPPQELQTLETFATQQHIPVETVVVNLLKIVLREHKNMQEIIRQVHQRYSLKTQVSIEVELLGPITWG